MRTREPLSSTPNVPGWPPGSSASRRPDVSSSAFATPTAVDRLPRAQRDVAVAVRERTEEGDRDLLLDEPASRPAPPATRTSACGSVKDWAAARGRRRERRSESGDDRRARAPRRRTGIRTGPGPAGAPAPRSRSTRRGEVEHAGDDVRGNGLDRGVVGQHRVVVDLPGDRDRLLDLGQLGLERRSSRSPAARGRPRRARTGGRAPAVSMFSAFACSATLLDVLCGRARPRHGLERLALVGGVALDGLDEVRDQVVAAPELHVDLRPRVLGPVAQPHELVVERDADHDEQTTTTAAMMIPTITAVSLTTRSVGDKAGRRGRDAVGAGHDPPLR